MTGTITVTKQVDVSIKYLLVEIPIDEPYALEFFCIHKIGDDRIIDDENELRRDYPQIFGKDSSLLIKIDVDNGKVVNWDGLVGTFTNYKIVDEGKYSLTSEDGKAIIEYEGYVPDCIGSGGYGDYLMFDIEESGKLDEWEFHQSDIDQFFDNADDE